MRARDAVWRARGGSLRISAYSSRRAPNRGNTKKSSRYFSRRTGDLRISGAAAADFSVGARDARGGVCVASLDVERVYPWGPGARWRWDWVKFDDSSAGQRAEAVSERRRP